MSDISPDEYEARESLVTMPCKCSVTANAICFFGNITEKVYTDKNHTKVQLIRRETLKIPMYFGEREALLAALHRYQ
jgi:hypothetical protein